jgi:magnesium-transporting ATPase (P-type)
MANPLSITQILWINLVMDTLAALAFGGEPALKRFMQEKPKRRDENIVSPYMWSSILTGSLWVFALSLFLLLSPIAESAFRAGPDRQFLLTGYFVFFIFASVFNAFNARTDQFNLFDNIARNKGFLQIILLIVVVQIIMTYLGGVILRCFGLTAPEWAFVLLLAATIIPVDLIRKAIVKGTAKNA